MDNRTLKEKLRAMANQIVSPNEAAIAKKKLLEMGEAPVVPKVVLSVSTRLDLHDNQIYQRISFTDGTVEDNIFSKYEFMKYSGIGSIAFDAPAIRRVYPPVA